MAALIPAMSVPQGMTSEIVEYIQEMIRLNHKAHDGEIVVEMDARDAKTKSAIAGEVAALKAMTETLHTETGAAFQRLKTEADAFTKKLEEAAAAEPTELVSTSSPKRTRGIISAWITQLGSCSASRSGSVSRFGRSFT